MRDAPNTLLAGRYELIDQIGKGGMAVVWRAKVRGAAGFARTVAVKRMLLDIARDSKTVAMFIEEARVGAQLAHPNVVQVLDFGQDEDGTYYLVMEWVDGLDFLDYMRSFHQVRQHVPWQAVAAVAHQTANGLAAAHERIDDDGVAKPVFHRDISPSNLLLSEVGVVKIADFGLARAMDRITQTLPNIIKGKMAYTAPELAVGGKANPRTDIFAVGVTMWEALAGRRLFSGDSPMEVIRNIQAWKIPSLATLRPDAPLSLVRAIESAIAKRAEDRPASARDLARAFEIPLRAARPPIDDAVLGASVRAARERLRYIDAANRVETIEVKDSDLVSSVSIDVSFDASPASKRVSSKMPVPSHQKGVFVEEAPTVPRPVDPKRPVAVPRPGDKPRPR